MVDLSALVPWRSKDQVLHFQVRTALSLVGFAASLVFLFGVTLM